MSEKVMMVLLAPIHPSEKEEFSDEATRICESEEQYREEYDRYEKLKEALEIFGFKSSEGRNSSIYLEWCNGDGKAAGHLVYADDTALAKLSDKAAEWLLLREQALAKLTDTEKAALGVYDHEQYCEYCARTKRRRGEW